MFRDRRKTRFQFLLAVAVLLPAAGCTAVTNTSMMPRRFDDPRRVSPGDRYPNGVPSPYGNGLAGRATQGAPAGTTPEPIPKIAQDADDSDAGAGPNLIPGGSTARTRVKVTIAASERVQVGGVVTFGIAVSNRSNRPLANVVIEADFDAALVFPGRPEKRIRRSLGDMQAGETREVAVVLNSDEPGVHCARFLVTVAGEEAAWKETCVTYVDRDLDVGVLGPRERSLGSRAEFTVKLHNRAAREVAGVQVAVKFDDALQPRESSTGAQLGKQSLQWDLGAMKPGETVWLQVEFECVQTAESACVSVDVSSADVDVERVSHCLRVAAPHGLLGVEVRDTRDPVTIGDTTDHVITVHNRTPQTLHGIRLRAIVPRNLRVLSTSVSLDDRELALEAAVEDGRVDFDPLSALPAGTSVTFRLRNRALSAGDAELTVQVEHALGRNPVIAGEPLSVIAE